MSKNCLSCTGPLHLIYDFGFMPAVNSFFPIEKIHLEQKTPLMLYVCESCYLIQLSEVPNPEILFDDYHHLSSASKGNTLHLDSVKEFIKNNFDEKSKILEIGANDLYLTKLLNEDFQVIAIDPAKNINDEQENLIIDYFNSTAVKKIQNQFGKFDLIIGLNVFAHNASFKDMFASAKELMHEESFLLFEVAYAVDTICNGVFDTIYHEHVCSYTLTSLQNLFDDIGLEIQYVEKLDTQGGSLRVIAGKDKVFVSQNNQYKEILKKEEELKVNSLDFYNGLTSKINHNIEKINKFIEKVNNEDSGLIILGAPARGVITLNSVNKITTDVAIIDDTILKQSKVMPGVHHKIYDWNIDLNAYDNCLILSWNYSEYLFDKITKSDFRGRTFVPFPLFTELN